MNWNRRLKDSLAFTAGTILGGDCGLVVHTAAQAIQRILGDGALVRHDDRPTGQRCGIGKIDGRGGAGLSIAFLRYRVQIGIHSSMISELDREGTLCRNLQTFGRGIGNGKGVRIPASRSMRNVRGHSEVHGVAHLYALTVHIHVIHPGELERLVGRIRVLRVELAFSRDVALTGRRIGRNPQIGQSIDGGGHHSRSSRRHSRFRQPW